MNHTKCFLSTLALLFISSSALIAGNITVNSARTVANNFIKQHATLAPGTLRAIASSDLTLSHAEASSAVAGANDYYAFNIKGGGFIIVAGEDRAAQVLGYSDKGRIDFNNLPAPLEDLLNGYKKEIEFLQTYKGNDLVVNHSTIKATSSVDPLIKTTWGQEDPYDWQCPIYQGQYCVVGCVATAMAQVMNYWQYPTQCNGLSAFNSTGYGRVSALPATTFDYSLMLDSYCHWDWDNSQLVQDTYTDAQAQEVAKLGRYCGQAAKMQYSPDGSGAYTWDQLSAMKNFGYSNNAQDVQKGYSWNSTAQWESMIRTELDAGRPILYSANDPSAGGHAFICDGYNSSNYFHFNFGWYGTCDGWYLSTALNMIHREGDQLKFNSGHEMLIGVEPPAYCIFNAESVNVNSGLIVLGDQVNTEAQNVTLRTSYNNVNVYFGLIDANSNQVCTGNQISISKNSFEQGSSIDGAITIPATLAEGTYSIGFYYYTTDANNQTKVMETQEKLNVVGHLAKFNEPFTINDVTRTINYLLEGSKPVLSIADVTKLINYLLNQ